jgi:hypothetical protein
MQTYIEMLKKALAGFGRSSFRHPEPSVRFSFGVLIFTGLLFLVAAMQTWAFVQSERAFVVPSKTDFSNWPLVVGENLLEMYIEFKNSGKTAATFEDFTVAISHELDSAPNYSEGQKIAFAPITAGGSNKAFLNFETGWGELTISKIKSGALKFYIFGQVKYRDAFSFFPFGVRETGYCYVFTPEKRGREHAFSTCHSRPYTFSR